MTKKLKSRLGKSTQYSMRDKYWKQILLFTEKKSWPELLEYVENYPWIASSFMGVKILPDYLAGDKEYGILRLLCNVEDVPVDLIRRLIALGARDRQGRAYLERLLVGESDRGEDNRQLSAAEDSPLVAAELLKTCTYPAEVIDRTHRLLEQGLEDSDPQRKALAERCIDRSRLFYNLLMLLYEHDASEQLDSCLGSEELLLLATTGELSDFATIQKILD